MAGVGVPMITERDLQAWAEREQLIIRDIGSMSDGVSSHREVKIVPLDQTIILSRVKVFDINEEQGIQLRLNC